MKTARTDLITLPAERNLSALHWAARIGIFLCFLGHGAFAIMAKPEWAEFFGVVGISPDVGARIMPLIGLLDITVASFALASPRPVVLLWAAVWCLWTATLRPLSGLGMWEFWARAGNYGLPIALLALQPWSRSPREWMAPLTPGGVTTERLRVAGKILLSTIVLLLVGHAGLGVFQQKEGLLAMYAKAGLPSHLGGIELATAIGWFELALAAAVLVKPFRGLLLFVCAFKMAIGLLDPIAGAYWWEFIEHGAAYMAPIALILVNQALAARAVRVPSVPEALSPVGAASSAAASQGVAEP